jgi:Eco57I restriction-modification methylase
MSPSAVSVGALRAIKQQSDVLDLLGDLGYAAAKAAPLDHEQLGLDGLTSASGFRSDRGSRKGHGVLVGETKEIPRSLRALASSLQRSFHDRPLGILGEMGATGEWQRMVVFRPRRTSGRLGAITVSRLDVDLEHPTAHDAEVLSELRWQADRDDASAQAALDAAMDIERVTSRFYKGLVPHFEALETAVAGAASKNLAVQGGIDLAGGQRRVAIRILTQILFCYFLQRKSLLAGDRQYLARSYSSRSDRFYSGVLEPLFYSVLALPATARPTGLGNLEIPFLNGGLFERRYGDISLDLPDVVFDLDTGLLGYLNRWTFTVAEERADEAEVAVDPEMLGRIFESLLPDNEREQKGTYYTPRPVVQFMCREALIARLCGEPGVDEAHLRLLISADDPLRDLAEREEPSDMERILRTVDSAIDVLTILDPAVGSGAFLLGMLGEMLRLRGIAYQVAHGRHPTPEQIHAWKLHAVERSLFGVDIEPTAIELCRLRLWLSLVVELDASRPVPPLPNLEYRTICANSLVDFVAGVAIQDTRQHDAELTLGDPISAEVIDLRGRFFTTADPTGKRELRGRLVDAETALLTNWLEAKKAELHRQPNAQAHMDRLIEQLRSSDRVYPVFMPGFSAPDVWQHGGWDVVIMNPPYVGRKEIPQRFHDGEVFVDALKRHFGDTADLMILFGKRAFQLTSPQGVVSMIFNDSIFTSTDGNAYRRELVRDRAISVIARTKCFEGQAINGGVVVARTGRQEGGTTRWVEGYRRPTQDFAGASVPLTEGEGTPDHPAEAGAMEIFSVPRTTYGVLPHRPLFRPSREALDLIDRFTAVPEWSDYLRENGERWDALSNTAALDKVIISRRETGYYRNLRPGDWVLMGLVTEGGQGLATADDRRFLGAIEGTSAAADHLAMQERLEKLTLNSSLADEYNNLRRTHGDREAALLALWAAHGAKRPNPLANFAKWPRTGTFRMAPPEHVRRTPLRENEREGGIAGSVCWVPFEKGDQSQEAEDGSGGHKMGAAWGRDNPIVIDWSSTAVSLLRRRARDKGAQSPRLQNEALWFHEGLTWNRVASYLRVRSVPEGSIFGDVTPLLRPRPEAPWLTVPSLLALLNGDAVDFLLRTFLGSRMHIEVGDLRRIPIPVLSDTQQKDLEVLTARAIEAKRNFDGNGTGERLTAVEAEVNAYIRALYGVAPDAKLWVVR